MEDLRPHPQGLVKGRSAERHDHKFLYVDIVIGMLPPVEDVHHRDGELMCINASQIAIQGKGKILRRCLGAGQRYPQDGVSTEHRFVRSAVQINEDLIDGHLF